MKKKMFVLCLSIICVVLCACGLNAGSQDLGNQMNDDAEIPEFSAVGEWVEVLRGSGDLVYTFHEDGTFGSEMYGDGFKYEYIPEMNVVNVDINSLGSERAQMHSAMDNIILYISYENGIYHMKADYMQFDLVPLNQYENYIAQREAEHEANKEPLLIEGLYLVSQDDHFAYGFYLDGQGQYIKVDAEGVKKGSYNYEEYTDPETGIIRYTIDTGYDNDDPAGRLIKIALMPDGKIMSNKNVSKDEVREFEFIEVDEDTFYNYFK